MGWKPKFGGKLFSPRAIRAPQSISAPRSSTTSRYGYVNGVFQRIVDDDERDAFDQENKNTSSGRYYDSPKPSANVQRSPEAFGVISRTYPSPQSGGNSYSRNGNIPENRSSSGDLGGRYGHGRGVMYEDNDPYSEEYGYYGRNGGIGYNNNNNYPSRRNHKYGGNNNLTKREKKKFSFEQTRWSSYNFSTFLTREEDDDSDLMVKEPESYTTPTAAEIRQRSSIWDDKYIKRIKELSRVCYFKMIDDKNYLAEDFLDPSKGIPMDSDEFESRCELYDGIYEKFIPGFTPLEQALSIHYQLMDNLAKARIKPHGGVPSEYDKSIHFRRDVYNDATINNLCDKTVFSKAYKNEILRNISIIGDLGSQFKVAKDIGEKEVASSMLIRKKMLNTYDQINKIDLYQRFFPNYRLKFITKDLIVNIPVEESEKKQVLIILVDFSGSMGRVEKQTWVNALLIDRFRYVIKGEAEVYFSFFVHNPEDLKFIHIKNEKDVDHFWKYHFSNSPSGGMTNIGRIVEYVNDEINRGKLHNLNVNLSHQRPEILIVNDGQDEVGRESFPYKVNAISLMEFSDELKDLCVATGGKQVQVTRAHEIITYSQEGEIVLST